ncbi:hypothetical protein GCM10009864_74360 [Streptomyces lunalinharesii]|uniref:Uncharacterized protein n=1 Tax=Streptomyces lunalinharesii TaxID=333384 RepID=A0ABN3T2A1_9ACTN
MRTEAAQVGVSTLGKTLSTLRFVEPGGYGPEAFEGVHGAFGFVPAGVLVPVEAGGSAARAATASAIRPS